MRTEKSRSRKKSGLHQVATGLYKMGSSGRYYANIRRQGKLVRQSLKTTDRKLAERRLRNLLVKVDGIKPDAAKITFSEVAEKWRTEVLASKDLKPRAREYREGCLAGLFKFWPALETCLVRDISKSDCEQWLAKRKERFSAQLVNNEMGTLRMILDYAVREGAVFENPALVLKRVKIPHKEALIPTREQFTQLVNKIRQDGCEDSADFIELLAYSGMRRNEAASLTWGDVDFNRGQFAVTGGEQGTKNRQVRHVPLFPSLRNLLESIRNKRGGNPPPEDRVLIIKDCHYSIINNCTRLKMPRFGHHSMRHFFVSNAIKLGIDFKTIAAWVGHSDGGILVAKTYGHLRQQHREAMANKMTFAVSFYGYS